MAPPHIATEDQNSKTFGICGKDFANYILECWFHRRLWTFWFQFISLFLPLLLFFGMFAFSIINCAHVPTAHDDLFNWPPTLNSIHFTFSYLWSRDSERTTLCAVNGPVPQLEHLYVFDNFLIFERFSYGKCWLFYEKLRLLPFLDELFIFFHLIQ